MSEARDQIFAGIRNALKRGPLDDASAAQLEARVRDHRRNLVPKRSELPDADRVELFVKMATNVSCTVARVERLDDVPGEVAHYLANNNLPSQVRMGTEPMLSTIPWDQRPTLEVLTGRAQEPDHVSLTGAFAAIAETGTIMMLSGPEHPTTLNFLPDTQIVVLRSDQVVGPYEEAWDRVRQRAADSGAGMPRTVNLITGPSRTGDIEQTILLGAHGPRRLHIVLVDSAAA